MKIMSIEEASKYCNKSQKTLRRAIAANQLNAVKIQNHYRIDFSDLQNYLNKKTDEKVPSKNPNTLSDKVNWADISAVWKRDGWKNSKERNGLHFIDLFSGAGGLSCGLVMAGFSPLASVEILPTAVETYEYNFIQKKKFNEKVHTRDIRQEEVKNEIVEAVNNKKVDLIVGGFPCQGFSMSGYRVVADPRNSLYLEMLSIVKRIQPDFIVMENVEGLRSMMNGKVEEKIINDYKRIGYKINVTVLNAADYYTPQTRRRVIFIGNRIGAINYHPKPLVEEKNYKTVGSAIKKYLDIEERPEINHIFTKTSPSMKKRLENLPIGKSLYKNYSDAWKKVDWNKPSCTVKENHGGVNIHPILNRPMTPRELACLQSFPDDFIFKGSKKWQLLQIGNAVPCFLGKAIGLAVEYSITEHNKKKN